MGITIIITISKAPKSIVEPTTPSVWIIVTITPSSDAIKK